MRHQVTSTAVHTKKGKMGYVAIALVLVVLVIAVCAWVHRERARDVDIFIGDSVTAAKGVRSSQGWAARFAHMDNAKEANYAVSGRGYVGGYLPTADTIFPGQLQQAIKDYGSQNGRVKRVFVQGGFDDYVTVSGTTTGGHNPSESVAAMQTMIPKIRKAFPKAQIVLMTDPVGPLTYNLKEHGWNDWFQDDQTYVDGLVKASQGLSNVVVVPGFWAYYWDQPTSSVQSDGKHPTAEAHNLIAQRMAAMLNRAGGRKVGNTQNGTAVPVSQMKVDRDEVTGAPGDSVVVHASLVPSTTTDTEINWVSTDPQTVQVTGGKNGAATIMLKSATDPNTPTTVCAIAAGGRIMSTISVTVSGEYDAPAVKVSFNANGGEGSVDPLHLYRGERLRVPSANDVHRDGYRLKGWGTSPDSTAVIIPGGTLQLKVDEDFTLYAIWLPSRNDTTNGNGDSKQSNAKSVIAFNPNGGTGTIDDLTAGVGEEVTFPSSGFTRDGYVLSSWNTKPDGTGTTVKLGQSVNIPRVFKTVMYAQWTKDK